MTERKARRKLDHRLGYVLPAFLVLMALLLALLPGGVLHRAEYGLRLLTGRREVNGVWLCRERLVALPETAEEGLPEENVRAVEAYADAHPESRVYLAVVPSAARILPETADGFPAEPTEASGLLEDAAWVDIAAALLPHREEEIFFRTAPGWTSLGALYGWQAIAAEIGLEPGEFDACLVSVSCQGPLAQQANASWLFDDLRLLLPRTGVRCSPGVYDPAALEGDAQLDIFPGPGTELTTDACTCRSLLVIGGEAAGPLVSLLCPAFDRVVISDAPTEPTGFTHVLFLPEEEQFITEAIFGES